MAAPAPTDDYYQVLELPPTAAPEAITKSYRRLALLRHPDRNPGVKDATAKFQLLQNAYETLSSPSQRRAYDIGFFHRQHHQHHHYQYHQPSYFNAAANPGRFGPQTKADRRAAAEEAARQDRFHAAKQRTLSSLAAESLELKTQVWALDRAIRKVEEELRGMEEADRKDEAAEKEARNPRTWFWNLAGMAARKGRVEEEEGRRKTERRHREEGRRVRGKEVERKRREREELMGRLWENQERFRRAQMETLEEFERAEEERIKRERKERERMEQEWAEAEMERARRLREEEDLLRKMEEEEKMEETKELFEEFSERIETEENEELWQDGFCEEAEEGLNQESEWRGEARHDNPAQSGNFEHVKCEHDYDWRRVERGHLCSRCGILSLDSMFRCDGCFKVVCEDCQRMLRGEAKWKAFDAQPDIFQGGGFSVF